jgi:uncharacterized ParB-like nuclease family protein
MNPNRKGTPAQPGMPLECRSNEAERALSSEIRGAPQEVDIDTITVDAAAQMRVAGTDPATVADYAEAMESGAKFPPIVVFHDGDGYHLADGFQRVEAARKIGREAILADVRQGGRRDAILFAVGANANHGLRRTQDDKRRAVETLLRDPAWSRMSDRKVGEAAKVDHKTVAKIKRELTDGEIPTPRPTRASSGEIPTAVPSGSHTMVERMLATASTEALVAECERRGLSVLGSVK